MSDLDQQLKIFRDQIDSLDREIVKSIQTRAEFASKIGEIKRERNEPVFRPDREKEVYEKIKSFSPGPLPDKVLLAIYREIMSGSISVEKRIRDWLFRTGRFFFQSGGSFSFWSFDQRFRVQFDSRRFSRRRNR